MALLSALDLARFPQESCSRVKSVFHEFVKHPKITEVKSKLYSYKKMFGVINGLRIIPYFDVLCETLLAPYLLIFFYNAH